MNKPIGYLISIIGLVGLSAWSSADLNKVISKVLPFIENISNTILLIISIVLIAIGLFLVTKSPAYSRKSKEVPIFRGKEIIGYRRH